MPTELMQFPLVHPSFVLQDPQGDQFISQDQIAPSFAKRQWRKVKKHILRQT
jgi:hypothetical protein